MAASQGGLRNRNDVRILHVTDSFAPKIGGIERQVEALARHQLDAGHHVRVVTAVPSEEPDVGDLGLIRPRGSRVRTSGSPRQIRQLSRRALYGRDVDVIHAHLSFASPLAVHTARYATRHGIPLALTVHSMWPERWIATRSANLPYWWLPIHGAWSAVSTAAIPNMKIVLGAQTEVMVVPNIVDTSWWHPTRPFRPTDARDIRIVTVGRLARRKRVEPFIEILREARSRLDPGVAMNVTIVGEGSRRARVTQLLNEYEMSGWVHLIGQQEPTFIRDLLQDSDLFVAPAVRESFGIAALEARSAGLPVIGLRRNGLSDFIDDGEEGVLCADDAAMADALVALCTDVSSLTRMRERTTSTPPSLDAKDALRAVDELYERARSSVPR
jgi:glycosyltransferase involved in cell wall biosynthesis